MGSHNQPTSQQLQPLVQHNQSFWVGFTKAVTIGGAAIIILLALMAAFLVKHP